MNYQQKYQQAKESGYTDQEIMEYLGTKDPSFEQKMIKAQEAGYTPEQVLGYFNTPTNTTSSKLAKAEKYLEDSTSDIQKQAVQGFGIGALGTYGDILDLFGLQTKQTLPGEKAKYERESNILDKEQKGQVPSAGELMELSDDDIIPRYSKLPSSHEVEGIGKQLGLVSDPKTIAGRYARRMGRIGGGGASFGGGGILAPIVAGAVGQTLEQAGAPPWAQAAGEIIAGLKFAPKSNVPITSNSKEVEQTIKGLRAAGYTEKDITLAKSALEDRKILKKFSTLTPKAENAIQQGVKNSEELFKQQIKKGLPGYAEGGIPYLEKQASNLYGAMEELAANVPIKNTEPVKKSIEGAIQYLEKFPLLDEQKKFIEFMKDGLNKLKGDKGVGTVAKQGESVLNADFLTGFYRNLGKAGNWGNPKQKEHLLGLIKQGIKDSFAESGPEAARFGKLFEKTNEGWKKWLNARDLMQTIEKTHDVDGMNFKKLANVLNRPENHELAKKVLGPEQLENIKTINKGAEAIGSLLKQFPGHQKVILGIEGATALYYVMNGDYKKAGAIIGIEAARRLGTRMLINPEAQNTVKKIITAAKNNSPQQAAVLAQELIEEPSQKRDSDNNL